MCEFIRAFLSLEMFNSPARMTRVRMSEYHSGLIARHHVFENYPQATTLHTTASLDYLIVALSILLQPFTAHALDLAGAQPIKHTSWFRSRSRHRFFRFCVIGTSRFGQTKWNTHAERSSATNRLQLRDLAISLESSQVRPFLAPWWF